MLSILICGLNPENNLDVILHLHIMQYVNLYVLYLPILVLPPCRFPVFGVSHPLFTKQKTFSYTQSYKNTVTLEQLQLVSLCIMGACQITAFWYVVTKLQQDTLKKTLHARSLSRSHSNVFVQTRIIHNFISATRSTYRLKTPQTKLTTLGHVYTVHLDSDSVLFQCLPADSSQTCEVVHLKTTHNKNIKMIYFWSCKKKPT